MSCNSSFCGVITELPGISVDNFENHGKRAYFLSHAHTDHTVGLRNTAKYNNGNSDFAEYLHKSEVFIYMSEITAKIFEFEFCDLAAFVKPLKMGVLHFISLPATNDYEELNFNATLIPAGHCLGSAMFLLQVNRKTVLYTGDFRYTQNDVSKIRDLHNPRDRCEPIHIDTMYMDTTFIDCTKEDLPKRSESVNYLIREVKEWLAKGDEYKVALSTSAKYGYEYVFNEIYKILGLKVYVNDAKWGLYRKMTNTLPGVTNDKHQIDIHNCSSYNHNFCDIPDKGKYKFLSVRLSAMKWKGYDVDDLPIEKCNDAVSVCFSTHCSRRELVYFVNHFKPNKVVGFPNKYEVVKTPRKADNIVLSPVKRKRVKRPVL